MKPVSYILINETSSQNIGGAVSGCHLPDIRQHIVVEAGGNLLDAGLIDRIVGLRRHHPDAKILGLSELGDYRVHPSDAMNAIRRRLSDMP